MKVLAKEGIEADYYLHCWDCHVDDGRNSLVRLFLDSEVETFIFIDDDVGWQAEDLLKLIRADGDIVCGAYPLKQDLEDYPVRTLPGTLQARDDGLLEIEGAPTGFMKIKREVLVKIAEKKKWTQFRARSTKPADSLHTIIFERSLVDGHRWSGDYNFCRECRGLGFKVFVDPEMFFTHEGSKQWSGHFGNYLRNAQGIMHPKRDDAFRRLLNGEASAEVFANMFAYSYNAYAAGPLMNAYMYDAVSKTSGDVLETGSGNTTIAMGIAALKSGATIHTLEHDMVWFRKTRDLLKKYQLKSVRLYYAPLQERPDGTCWYEIPDGLPDKFDLALCDGPPRMFGRSGFFDLIGDRVEDAEVVVDDMDDDKALEPVKEYAEETGREVEVVGDTNDILSRRFAVVKRTAEAAASSAA